jgi:hypothetical protein
MFMHKLLALLAPVLSSAQTFAPEAYIKAANGERSDRFGGSVALSDDGNTLVVGAVDESNCAGIINGPDGYDANGRNGCSDAGAVYVFARVGDTWAPEAYLKAPNAQANEEFGKYVAISGDGNTVAVGVRFEDGCAGIINGPDGYDTTNACSNAGAAYVFARVGTTWAAQAFLKAPNAEAGDEFGMYVALSGDGSTLVVGAREEAGCNPTIINAADGYDTANGCTRAGAVYAFAHTGNTWVAHAYLKARNTEADDLFGQALALSHDGNTVAAGTADEDGCQRVVTNNLGRRTADTRNRCAAQGAAYIFAPPVTNSPTAAPTSSRVNSVLSFTAADQCTPAAKTAVQTAVQSQVTPIGGLVESVECYVQGAGRRTQATPNTIGQATFTVIISFLIASQAAGVAALQALLTTPAAATAALGVTVANIPAIDGATINLSLFPLCLCENFMNGATTDLQGQYGCARKEVHGLSGVETSCKMPSRPYIPHVDDGCDSDTRRCLVTYMAPTFASCSCSSFHNGVTHNDPNGVCQKKGTGECYPRNYKGDKHIGNSEFFACAEDMYRCVTATASVTV